MCIDSAKFTPHSALLSLQWRHNGHAGVSNHQPHHCLLIRLFGRRSKKTSKFRVTGLCVGNSPGIGDFPAQMASNAENVWWRHHDYSSKPYGGQGCVAVAVLVPCGSVVERRCRWECVCTLITRFMGPTWGPSVTGRTQLGPMLAPWTLLSRYVLFDLLLTFYDIDIKRHEQRATSVASSTNAD